MKKYILLGVIVLSVALSACKAEPATLTVMTHDSFAVSDDVIAAFEKENNVKVNFLSSGDAGSALNRAVLSKSAPLADVLYGVDNTFLSRALSEDIYEAYQSRCWIRSRMSSSWMPAIAPCRGLRRRVHQLRESLLRAEETGTAADIGRPDQA
jgi:ABC-type thiamine transport system substrate-binding protein